MTGKRFSDGLSDSKLDHGYDICFNTQDLMITLQDMFAVLVIPKRRELP